MPWIARERTRASGGLRAFACAGFAVALLLAADSAALAQAPIEATPDAVPVVTGQTPPAAKPATHAPEKPAPRPTPVAPHDLRHVQDWVEYRSARHLASLPTEARLFYRRGILARQAGDPQEALVNVRGAAELDPSFVDPHLTLAAWMLTQEPSQALLQYATVIELLRQNFNLQLGLASNAAILSARALFVGLLFACMIVVWLRRDELTHAWREHLTRFASAAGARWWALALLVFPYLTGFGLTLPTLGFLGFLWPSLRPRERTLAVLLLAAVFATPFTLASLGRMALPLHADEAPFYGVPLLESEPYSHDRQDRLQALAAHAPDDALLQFGLAWTARRGNDLPAAERAYRRALELWPGNARVLDNLGNVLAMEGRNDEALDCYKRSIAADPTNAAAYFNSSQLHTQRYDYQAANDALSRASALNFELVRTYQSQATSDGLLPLVDQWLAPAALWDVLWKAPLPHSLASSLPVTLRGNMEATGWGFSLLALLVTALALVGGWQQHKHLPLRACSNCGRVVCRRCAERRREHALCPQCAAVESQAETHDFSRVLLMQFRQKRSRRTQLVRTALAAIIPGYGLLAHRRVFTAVFLLASSWLLAGLWVGAPPPISVEPRLTLAGQEVPIVLVVGLAILVYTISLARYVELSAREQSREAALQASQRGRITQSTRRITPLAA